MGIDGDGFGKDGVEGDLLAAVHLGEPAVEGIAFPGRLGQLGQLAFGVRLGACNVAFAAVGVEGDDDGQVLVRVVAALVSGPLGVDGGGFVEDGLQRDFLAALRFGEPAQEIVSEPDGLGQLVQTALGVDLGRLNVAASAVGIKGDDDRQILVGSVAEDVLRRDGLREDADGEHADDHQHRQQAGSQFSEILHVVTPFRKVMN